ncbi:hypothetical protein B0J11DRAFT_578121 [Dendryphion nanum]|uniref:J domain-containing protein n=1 Tax=Dendryphion nanum TaxID=256645 RepID=A0A9P9E4I9_9PLEO|nr:hypothetical protein B0J11DRAFT_578121 [Dendryphion nanum]
MALPLPPDPYKALGVRRSAPIATIKDQYRKRVLKVHPDKFNDPKLKEQNQIKFYELQQAYEILRNEERRAKYDADVRLEERREWLEKLEKWNKDEEEYQERVKICEDWNLRYHGCRYPRLFSPLREYSTDNLSTIAVVNCNLSHRSPNTTKKKKKKRRPRKKTSRGCEVKVGPDHEKSEFAPDTAQDFEMNHQEHKGSKVGMMKGLRGLKGTKGLLKQSSVIALCDTGAEKNFIAEATAKEIGLCIEWLSDADQPCCRLGNGKEIYGTGLINTTWLFQADRECKEYEITFNVLSDCIFDVMLGSDFLDKTGIMIEDHRWLCPMPRARGAPTTSLVNLCGPPGRRLRGTLESKECSALLDSGAEPNILSYEYVERRGWLPNMFAGPESCRLLQFADGSTVFADGRLRLKWGFITQECGIAPENSNTYVDFDVLRGCPHDIILGIDFLDNTNAFTQHQDSFHEIIRDEVTGLNVVVWVKSKMDRKKEKSRKSNQVAIQNRIQELQYSAIERRATEEWAAHNRKGPSLGSDDSLSIFSRSGVAPTTIPSSPDPRVDTTSIESVVSNVPLPLNGYQNSSSGTDLPLQTTSLQPASEPPEPPDPSPNLNSVQGRKVTTVSFAGSRATKNLIQNLPQDPGISLECSQAKKCCADWGAWVLLSFIIACICIDVFGY